jgi:predicted DNA-binding transcriptional regulator YafY
MRADRLLAILMLLQSKGRMTARALAEELEVSERTVYRDMDALGMAGVPVMAERGPGGGCALLDGYRTNLTGLTEGEVRALLMSRVTGPLAELGMHDAGEAALRKLSAALPAPHRHTLEQMRARIHVDPAGWAHLEEPVPYLALAQEAVWQDRRLRCIYRREDGSRVRRCLDPYGLEANGHIW